MTPKSTLFHIIRQFSSKFSIATLSLIFVQSISYAQVEAHPNISPAFSGPYSPPLVHIPVPDLIEGKLIDAELHGFQTVDFFSSCANGTEITNPGQRPDCLNQFIELKPTLLRFPGGTISQFSHPLCNRTGQQQGYGFSSSEIASFLNNYYTNDDQPYNINNLNSDITKWNAITAKNSLATTRYIDDFINLVHAIETSNPGHTVKVIFVANILTGTTQELIDILQLLKNNSISVVGIELGNEMFSYPRLFETGLEYYNFIVNGTPDPTDSWFNNTFIGGPSSHDYCLAIRQNYDTWIQNIPIGITSAPMAFYYHQYNGDSIPTANGNNETGQGKFFFYNQWNQQIAQFRKSNRLFPIGSTWVKKPTFDAYVFHPYYKFNLWKYTLNIQNASQYFISNSILYNGPTQPGQDDPICFNDFELLKNEILHFTSDNISLNSNGGAVQVFDYYATLFHLYKNDDGNRKLWMTEWNVLGDNQPIQNIWSNTYLQGMYIFNWTISCYKLSVNLKYKPNWIQFGAFHNTMGGSPAAFDNLISALDPRLDAPYLSPWQGNNISRKRVAYYAHYHLSNIGKGKYYLNQYTNDSTNIFNFASRPPGLNPTIYSFFDQSRYNWIQPIGSPVQKHKETYGYPPAITIGYSAPYYAEPQSPYYMLSANGADVTYIGNGANALTASNSYYNLTDNIYAPFEFPVMTAGSVAAPQSPIVFGYNFGLLKQGYAPPAQFQGSSIISDNSNLLKSGYSFTIDGQAYPVPANGVLNIPVNTLNADATLEIFDAMGRSVMEQPVGRTNSRLEVNTSDLGAGVYSYRLRTADSVGTARTFTVVH